MKNISFAPFIGHKTKQSKAIVMLVSSLLMVNVAQATEQWQPVASDKLMKLPANLIEKRIQQDFDSSPMANELIALEQQLVANGQQIKALQSLIAEPEGDMTDERFQLVQLKSEYLDTMQQSQKLRQQALNTKQSLYETLLSKMREHKGELSRSELVKLKEKQSAAKARMERVMVQVDQAIMHNGYGESSPYADEFAKNVAKIDQLKQAIAKHNAALSPTLNGVEVSAEEYVRQLLLEASTNQSLLDQESLMLSYMAKLVALDAQSLEYEIAYADDEDSSTHPLHATKPSAAVDLFL